MLLFPFIRAARNKTTTGAVNSIEIVIPCYMPLHFWRWLCQRFQTNFTNSMSERECKWNKHHNNMPCLNLYWPLSLSRSRQHIPYSFKYWFGKYCKSNSAANSESVLRFILIGVLLIAQKVSKHLSTNIWFVLFHTNFNICCIARSEIGKFVGAWLCACVHLQSSINPLIYLAASIHVINHYFLLFLFIFAWGCGVSDWIKSVVLLRIL